MAINKKLIFLMILSLLNLNLFSQDLKNYTLIKTSSKSMVVFGKKRRVNVAEINQQDINKLNEPLKALAAYYSGLGGSECDQEQCQLPIALGMGNQGSALQKNAILKWFPNDDAAKEMLKQNCFQSSSSSSVFSEYGLLKFTVKADTVFVNYSLSCYNHGKSIVITGPDKYLIKLNQIIVLSRNIWK